MIRQKEPLDIFMFDNSKGQNNCWLNSDLQVLLHIVQYIPIEDYQYRNVKIEAFMNYLKDPTMKSNIGIICVNDSNISMPGQSYKVSVKELFTTLIKKKT